MIEIKQLSKEYAGVSVVNKVSASVEGGETLVLLGPSGCGKTTTLKMINRLITPTSGSVFLDGQDLSLEPPHRIRKRMGFVIQNIGLFPHYSIRENIGLVPGLLDWDKSRIEDRIRQLMDLVGLEQSLLERYPAELSGGQQQRIGVARALAADPPVVLLDEPFGALDPLSREKIRREFMELEALMEKTMIMVTHDVSEAMDLGDRICLLDKGQVQQIGTPKELIFHPSNAYVRRFFDHHRFQLELQVLNLKDIVPFLEPPAQGMEGSWVELEEQNSIWDCLNRFEEATPIRVTDAVGATVVLTNSREFMPGFQQFKDQAL